MSKLKCKWQRGFDFCTEKLTGEMPFCPSCNEPLYEIDRCVFCGQEIDQDDEKLKRRVERNLAKMNIPSTTSPEAKYIVEIENGYEEKQSIENNSRDRILNMKKRLKKVKKGDYE